MEIVCVLTVFYRWTGSLMCVLVYATLTNVRRAGGLVVVRKSALYGGLCELIYQILH